MRTRPSARDRRDQEDRQGQPRNPFQRNRRSLDSESGAEGIRNQVALGWHYRNCLAVANTRTCVSLGRYLAPLVEFLLCGVTFQESYPQKIGGLYAQISYRAAWATSGMGCRRKGIL